MNSKQNILDNLLQELKRGTLVLSVLLTTKEPTYGYSLVTNLQQLGIKIEQNTLYPLLRRLEGMPGHISPKRGFGSGPWRTRSHRTSCISL